MEGFSGKESCSYEDRIYPHGSEAYILRRLMICIDGKWHDKELRGSFAPVP